MTSRLLLAAAVIAAITACGDKPAARHPTPKKAEPAIAAAPVAGDVAAELKPAAADWSYSSVGKRDPFRSFLSEIDQGASSLATRCATPLGRFELEQLKLVAVITGLEDPVAMVEAPGGTGYAVRRGACIGKNGGTVSAVRSGEVVVAEWQARGDGTRDRTQTVIRLPREAALNLEDNP